MLRWFTRILLVCAALACFQAQAQTITQEESDKVWADAKAAAQTGPAQVALAGQAVLALPAGRVYIPQPHANAVMRVMGNPGRDESLQGLVMPEDDAAWFVTINYEKSGYIKDDDAKEWNADDLLKSYKEGTEEGNEERIKMGFTPIEILGWAQKPTYDSAAHRLVWAMSSKDKGSPDSEPQGVNYNTYALGREGYFSMDLVTGLKELPTFKPEVHGLLDALQFDSGKRYADFNSKTDKVAEYGLAALVLGVAAKKLGFFALIAVFVAKFFKIIAIAVVAFGGGIMKWFRKKPVATPAAADVETVRGPLSPMGTAPAQKSSAAPDHAIPFADTEFSMPPPMAGPSDTQPQDLRKH